MSDEVEIAALKESVKSAHKRIDVHEEKKLSKHEFNGFVNVMENVKTMFYTQYNKVEKSTNENTEALTSLQTTFENMKEFLPILIKVLIFFGSVIVSILLAAMGIIAKNEGWW